MANVKNYFDMWAFTYMAAHHSSYPSDATSPVRQMLLPV